MINFRYHVVSLTSVFLALAIGLVLGTAALNGSLVDNLNDQLSSMRKSNEQYRDQVSELTEAAEAQGDFARTIAPSVMANKLRDRSVVVLSGPGAAAKDRDAIVSMVQLGGGRVAGTARLTRDFTDPRRDDTLHDLASRRVPAGVDLPDTGVGVDTAASLLAHVLTNKSISGEDRTTVLQAFTEIGVFNPDGSIEPPADAVLFVLGPAATERDADKRNDAMLSTIRQFHRAGTQVVVAAPLAGGDGNPVAAIRDDDELAKTVSTVDGSSSPEGQLAAAMAVVEEFGGKTGHYGTGDGASTRVPKLT